MDLLPVALITLSLSLMQDGKFSNINVYILNICGIPGGRF